MTIAQLIAQLRAANTDALEKRAQHTVALADLRERAASGGTVVQDEIDSHVRAKDAIDAEVEQRNARIGELEAELRADEAAARLQAEVHPTGVRAPKYDEVGRVGREERTYHKGNDRTGRDFLRDVGAAALGDFSARERVSRHMQEERVERGAEYIDRAAGTGAFAGLVVPQYLTELYAPNAKAARPFADAINRHELPPAGMTVNLSRITTGTSAAVQTENAAVSETNIDDTLLSISVQTNAGQQTLSRQAIERGTGVEGAMLDDLFRAYATNLDSTLINQATNGLTNVATSVAYTDASPTVAELYPKLLEGLAGVEGALLDQDAGDNIAVMHSRRWYWMQSSVGTSWPLVQQPGIMPQMTAVNYGEKYGPGFRGILPNGTPVIVDNNVATNLGAGTNEDEIYLVCRRECHLWEDPNAPMLIRAEQTSAASLGVLFVVYGYFAYTHARYTQARKIAGTGLVTPTF